MEYGAEDEKELILLLYRLDVQGSGHIKIVSNSFFDVARSSCARERQSAQGSG